jgi:hypothetical protein
LYFLDFFLFLATTSTTKAVACVDTCILVSPVRSSEATLLYILGAFVIRVAWTLKLPYFTKGATLEAVKELLTMNHPREPTTEQQVQS